MGIGKFSIGEVQPQPAKQRGHRVLIVPGNARFVLTGLDHVQRGWRLQRGLALQKQRAVGHRCT